MLGSHKEYFAKKTKESKVGRPKKVGLKIVS
jgi:hypothetical protein